MIYGGLALPRPWFPQVSNPFLLPQDIHFLRISVVMSLQDVANQFFVVASNLTSYLIFPLFLAFSWDLTFYLELSIRSHNWSWRVNQLHCLEFLCVCEYCSKGVAMYSGLHFNCLVPNLLISRSFICVCAPMQKQFCENVTISFPFFAYICQCISYIYFRTSITACANFRIDMHCFLRIGGWLVSSSLAFLSILYWRFHSWA